MFALSRQAAETPGRPVRAELDLPLADAIWPGMETRVFCCGGVVSPSPIEALELLVDGVAQRPDNVLQAMVGSEPGIRFWSALQVPASTPGTVAVAVSARLADGDTAVATLGEIAVEQPPVCPAAQPESPGALIAVCMATYEPDPELLRRQLDSLRRQTDTSWVCLISDDCSSAERYELIESEVGDDPRFAVTRSDRRLGFYRNFERALRLAPREAGLLALCDQDDFWYPEKLATLRAAIGSAPLAYSRARLTDPAGRPVGPGEWPDRRINRTEAASMLIDNTIPGAAALMRRVVADHAMPFPQLPGWQFHDHWLATVAMALGPIACVERPLYDYVQHPGAALYGRSGSDEEGSRAGRRAPAARWSVRWRGRYFYAFVPRRGFAQTLLGRVPRDRRGVRAVARIEKADRSLIPLVRLAMRSLRPLAWRDETRGYEWVLLTGLLWRRLVSLRTRLGRRRPPPESRPPNQSAEALAAPAWLTPSWRGGGRRGRRAG
jgi:glycosyltransferase involved in cell wall biosynthesis